MPRSAKALPAALFAALFAGLGSPAAVAGDLAVTVTQRDGRPVADAVVMVRAPVDPSAPIRFAWPLVVEQRNMQFAPFVLIVPVGASVAFPNRDPMRHHVYSFSPAKRFELKLYGRDESRTVRFDRAGVVALGCNIHDDMTAFIRVVDTPFAGKTSARGEVLIHNLPPGPVTVSIWHPYVKGGRDLTREAVSPAEGAVRLAVTLDLRAPPMGHGGY